MPRLPQPRSLATLELCAVLFLLLTAPLLAQRRQALQTKAAAPPGARLIGPMPASQQLSLALTLPLRNPDQLNALLQQLENPASPSHHQYLTAAQFTEQFGPTVAQYQQVIGFAQSHGFTVTHTSPSRRLLNLTGSVAQIEQAFQVTMQVYQHPTEKRTFYAPNVEPTADSGISLLGVSGLTNFVLPHPMLKHASSAQPTSGPYNPTGSGPGGQFYGSDMRAAYYGTGPLTGSGQALALAELGPWNMADVQAYFTAVGQTLNVPIVLQLLGGTSDACPGDCNDGEEVIDIQQIVSMAPGASVLIVYTDTSVNADVDIFDAYSTDNLSKAMSFSFGIGDGNAAADESYFQTFHAQGQNFLVASGDAGPYVGTSGWPGFSQNVTDVGGTNLTTASAGGAWSSEFAWVGSGSGWCDNTVSSSPCFGNNYGLIPSYQSPVINASNGGSTKFRNIVDVSAEANTDNFFCSSGTCQGGIGGTSLAAPRWAGFLALANEQAAANGDTVGFLNTTAYTIIGPGANYDTAFHDIASGWSQNSSLTCSVGAPGCLDGGQTVDGVTEPTGVEGFNAVTGYDLPSGWGTPNGEGMINALAPTSTTNAFFTLAASPTSLNLTPGADGTTTISLTAGNGFAGIVDLSAKIIGATDVTATLNPSSITGSGTSTLTVSTTSATPGGTYMLAVTGTSSGGIQTQPAYVTLALPDFYLSVSPSTIYLNQGASTGPTVTVNSQNSFSGTVDLSVSALPTGVTAAFSPPSTSSSSTLTLTASTTAVTVGSDYLTVSGVSGSTSPLNAPYTILSVSAATGTGGSGTPVSLTSAFNLAGVYTDGTTFSSSGGMDGLGSAYSSNLLTGNRKLNGVQFNFGPANQSDAVYGTGSAIPLPSGQFTALQLLATAIDGPILSQTITVTYTDSTTSTFTQSFSDWCSCSPSTPGPGQQPGESFAVVMPYRDLSTGVQDDRPFNLYAYTFVLNSSKTVQSLTLPNNRDVVVLAATLTTQSLGTQVSLASQYNTAGLFNNGVTFPTDGGMDGPNPTDNCSGGKSCDDAYSATTLGLSSATPPTLTLKGSTFNFGTVNSVDCSAPGTTCINDVISLPSTAVTVTPTSGQYSGMTILGTAVQGAHKGAITVTYTTGSPDTFDQTFSDWCNFRNVSGNESIAVGPFERINSDGTPNTDSSSCNLYAYTYTLDSTRTVSNIQLENADSPQTAYAYVAAITLTGNTTSPPPSYSLSAGTAIPTSVNPGSSAAAPVTIASANGYSGTVALSCSITPVVSGANAPTCGFGSTNPVTVTTAGGSATVTFTTVGPAGAVFQRQRPLSEIKNSSVIAGSIPTAKPSGTTFQFYALWLPLPGLALMGFGLSSRGSQRKRKRMLGWLLLCMALAALIMLPACGGSGYGGDGGGCTAVPGAPSGLTAPASSITSSGAALNWTAPASVPSGCTVTGYTVYQNGTPLSPTTTSLNYNVIGLAAATQYNFTVAASDSYGTSAQSSPSVSVTTLSNSAGTPTGIYTITITGEDANNMTQTGAAATVTVTVN
jgi:hypothetical protein